MGRIITAGVRPTTITLTAEQFRIARLAITRWDGWTGDDTITMSEFDTLLDVNDIFAVEARQLEAATA